MKVEFPVMLSTLMLSVMCVSLATMYVNDTWMIRLARTTPAPPTSPTSHESRGAPRQTIGTAITVQINTHCTSVRVWGAMMLSVATANSKIATQVRKQATHIATWMTLFATTPLASMAMAQYGFGSCARARSYFSGQRFWSTFQHLPSRTPW